MGSSRDFVFNGEQCNFRQTSYQAGELAAQEFVLVRSTSPKAPLSRPFDWSSHNDIYAALIRPSIPRYDEKASFNTEKRITTNSRQMQRQQQNVYHDQDCSDHQHLVSLIRSWRYRRTITLQCPTVESPASGPITSCHQVDFQSGLSHLPCGYREYPFTYFAFSPLMLAIEHLERRISLSGIHIHSPRPTHLHPALQNHQWLESQRLPGCIGAIIQHRNLHGLVHDPQQFRTHQEERGERRSSQR